MNNNLQTEAQNAPAQDFSGNKIILFANQKGGVGKTTLCGLFSNYLTTRGVKVIDIDADPQQNLSKCRIGDLDNLKRKYPDKDPNSFVKFNVKSFTLKNIDNVKTLVKMLATINETVIIDTPGSLATDGMVELLANSDYIICPYYFDLNSIVSTRTFAVIVQKLKERYPEYIKTKLLFVCNNKDIGQGTKEEKAVWKELKKYFQKFGTLIKPEIGHYKAVRNYNTISNDDKILSRVKPCFDVLFGIIYEGKTYEQF